MVDTWSVVSDVGEAGTCTASSENENEGEMSDGAAVRIRLPCREATTDDAGLLAKQTDLSTARIRRRTHELADFRDGVMAIKPGGGICPKIFR
jgi:hypothetical protein